MRCHGCLLSRQWLPTLGVEEGADLLAWGRWLMKEHPGHPIGLVGFSMGGLDVLHAMGRPGADEVFTAGAVAVSPAADLPRVVRYLDAKVYFADAGYSKGFRTGFQSLLRKRAKELGMTADGSFAETVEFLVAERPELGPTPAEFLRRANPSPSVAAARRPLLILVTSNDPIIPVSSIFELDRAADGNGFVHVIETPFGGHIGQPGNAPQWFAAILATFFRYAPSAAEAVSPIELPTLSGISRRRSGMSQGCGRLVRAPPIARPPSGRSARVWDL
jgi:predicted alpha/beta-fold hydrolase